MLSRVDVFYNEPTRVSDSDDCNIATAADGARFLDAYVPGWHNRIDPSRLNQQATRDCVLGQLFGHYAAGKSALRLKGSHRAFNGDVSRGPWFDEIEKRKATPDSPRAIADNVVFVRNGKAYIINLADVDSVLGALSKALELDAYNRENSIRALSALGEIYPFAD